MHKNINPEEIKKQEKKNKSIKRRDNFELHKMMNTFQSATGIVLVKEVTKWVAIGSFMGMSDAIPGYSGGTSMSLLGFFDKLVLLTKSVFVPEKEVTRKKAVMFLAPFFIGWIIGIFAFAKGTEFLASHNFGLELMFFFSSFVIFAIPVFLIGEKPDIGLKYKRYKHLWLRRSLFVSGFLLVLGFAIVVALTKYKGVASPYTGAPFKGKAEGGGFEFKLTTESVTTLAIVSFVAGGFTILPGGSGAIIQLLANKYQTIHWQIMSNLTDSWHNVGGLIVFSSSTIAGMLVSIFALAWLLKHHKSSLAALSFGMLCAASIAIMIVPEHDLWLNLKKTKHIVFVIVSAILGITFALTIYYHVKKRHDKINNITRRTRWGKLLNKNK